MSHQIDQLVRTAVFGSGQEQESARRQIHEMAREQGAVSASIQSLYEAIGRREVTQKFTVPAHNIRTLTYDLSRALFRAAMRNNVGAFVFEIARSEIGYTEQRPGEYAACVLAAAVREGFRGPVFLQGDHYQASAKRWAKPDERAKEVSALEALMEESIAAEFYNIDIDTSTLVDLSFPTVDEQQRANYEAAAAFTKFIRSASLADRDLRRERLVSRKTTPRRRFRAYMTAINAAWERDQGHQQGIDSDRFIARRLVLPDGTVPSENRFRDHPQDLESPVRSTVLPARFSTAPPSFRKKSLMNFPSRTVEILSRRFQNMVYTTSSSRRAA